MAANVPATMQSAIAVPAVMAAAMSMRVAMTVTALDLEDARGRSKVIGRWRGGSRRAGDEDEGRGGPDDFGYLHGNSLSDRAR
jgi:hypothetical protein